MSHEVIFGNSERGFYDYNEAMAYKEYVRASKASYGIAANEPVYILNNIFGDIEAEYIPDDDRLQCDVCKINKGEDDEKVM